MLLIQVKNIKNNGCRYLSKSENTISLDDAISEGYEPCSVCKPPKEN